MPKHQRPVQVYNRFLLWHHEGIAAELARWERLKNKYGRMFRFVIPMFNRSGMFKHTTCIFP